MKVYHVNGGGGGYSGGGGGYYGGSGYSGESISRVQHVVIMKCFQKKVFIHLSGVYFVDNEI